MLHTYYELVWSVVKIAELYLELFCANGEIQLSLGIKNKEYSLVLEYNAAGRAFQFEIIDWTEKNNRKQKKIIAGLKNPGEEQDFVRAFHLNLLRYRYFDCGNVTVYKVENGKTKIQKHVAERRKKMTFFENISDKFFNPFCCRNREIYFECISLLIEKSKEVPARMRQMQEIV